MSEPPDLEAIRTAVRQRIEATSLRSTAAEIGFSASGLRRIMEGRGRVYRTSRLRLECWYLERSGGVPRHGRSVGMDAARAALARMGRNLIPAGIALSVEAAMDTGESTEEAARESDAALLRRFTEGGESERAESFLTIYARYRNSVRAELEGAGLSVADAEERVGAVFGRTLNALRGKGVAGGESLRERLMDAARRLAEESARRRGR